MINNKILLIDDERIIRDEFIQIFQNSRFILDTASNSIEGLNKINTSNYAIVILDLQMPDFSNRFSKTAGIEFLKWIKDNRPHLSVIMLSVVKDIDIAVKAMKLGAKDYVAKDKFSVAELFSKIGDALSEEKTELISLIKTGESEKVEFKSSLRFDIVKQCPNKELEKVIAKSVSGFLNSYGGYLFIGISDKGEAIGIENDIKITSKKSEDAFLSTLYQIIIDFLGKEACQKIHPQIINFENKTICVIKIETGNLPTWFHDGQSQIFYLRLGQSTRPLDSKETHEYCLQRFKR